MIVNFTHVCHDDNFCDYDFMLTMQEIENIELEFNFLFEEIKVPDRVLNRVLDEVCNC
jgi:hypothetical protein